MRYTTIIDLTEFPALYRSPGVRLVYLHLVLKSGYHDDDRDLTNLSIRSIARETGLTIAAARHALAQLEKFELIRRTGSLWQVKKFVIERTITRRAQTKQQERKQAADQIREQEQAKRAKQQAAYDKMRAELEAQGKTSYMVYYEQQEELARRGDPNAILFVNSERKAYEEHKRQVQARNKQNHAPQ